MSGCYTCGGGMGKHDPVAHDQVVEDDDQCAEVSTDGYRCELTAGHPGYHEERTCHPRGAVRSWGATAWKVCASCEGTGGDGPEYPMDPCRECGGLGDIEYIPVVVKRRKQDWRANYYEAVRERNEAEAVVERVREFVDGFAGRGDGTVNTTDELWIMALRKVLDDES